MLTEMIPFRNDTLPWSYSPMAHIMCDSCSLPCLKTVPDLHLLLTVQAMGDYLISDTIREVFQ